VEGPSYPPEITFYSSNSPADKVYLISTSSASVLGLLDSTHGLTQSMRGIEIKATQSKACMTLV